LGVAFDEISNFTSILILTQSYYRQADKLKTPTNIEGHGMQYTVSHHKDVTCITFSGVLNALDMILMTQSQAFKQGIQANKKLLMNFVNIDGTQLTEDDVVALSTLGKVSLDNSGHTHIALITLNEDKVKIQAICQSVFAQTQTQIIATDNQNTALAMLGSE
jgi:hypothetical protein